MVEFKNSKNEILSIESEISACFYEERYTDIVNLVARLDFDTRNSLYQNPGIFYIILLAHTDENKYSDEFLYFYLSNSKIFEENNNTNRSIFQTICASIIRKKKYEDLIFIFLIDLKFSTLKEKNNYLKILKNPIKKINNFFNWVNLILIIQAIVVFSLRNIIRNHTNLIIVLLIFCIIVLLISAITSIFERKRTGIVNLFLLKFWLKFKVLRFYYLYRFFSRVIKVV